MAKEHTYYVKGMHCASCEVLIEKKLLEIPGVTSVNASTNRQEVTIEYKGEKPNVHALDHIFKKDNYTFSENQHQEKKDGRNSPANPTLVAFNIAIIIVIAFLLLEGMGISGALNIGSTSSLAAFFGFGLLAGLSSCAALVGGMVLSMSKQWQEIYAREQSGYKKFQPHILFNAGRILSYALFGGVLGLIGSRVQISLGITSFLIIAISLFMIAIALQMLGVKTFRGVWFSTPKFVTRFVADEKNFKGKYMPFIMGAATFFLPCGFTITAQTIALLSGSGLQGALIMGFFAIGTAPMLLFIGLSSVKFLSNRHWAERFSKTAGFLLLFFALFNITSQMNALGINAPHIFGANQVLSVDGNDLSPVVDGKQVIKMTVLATKYDPNYFKVKAGLPVRWEITSSGQPSCDSGAIVANGLLEGLLYLNPDAGQVTIAEFTAPDPGKYQFSCTMGMVRGTV